MIEVAVLLLLQSLVYLVHRIWIQLRDYGDRVNELPHGDSTGVRTILREILAASVARYRLLLDLRSCP